MRNDKGWLGEPSSLLQLTENIIFCERFFVYHLTQAHFMRTLEKSSYFPTALAASLLVHGMICGGTLLLPSPLQRNEIREYIPVELVPLPVPPPRVTAVPVIKRPVIAPRTLEKPVPVTVREQPQAPSSPHIAPLSQITTEISTSQQVSSIPALPAGGGGTGKGNGQTIGKGAPSAAPVAASPQKRTKGDYLAFHRLTRLPAFRSRSEPLYPDSERMSGGEARVLAEIYLDEQGRVDDVTIKKSGGRLFDSAVIAAVRKSSFQPGYMGEKPVATVIQIPYLFKLK
jgi:protein TonB